MQFSVIKGQSTPLRAILRAIVGVIHAFFSASSFSSSFSDQSDHAHDCLLMQSVGKLGFGGHKKGLSPTAASLDFYIAAFSAPARRRASN